MADIKILLRPHWNCRSGFRDRRCPWTCLGMLTPAVVFGLLWIVGGIAPLEAAGLSAAQREACLSASAAIAETVCRDALREDPRDAGIRVALSQTLVRSRRYEQAISILRDGLELDPGSVAFKAQLDSLEKLRDEQRWIDEQKQKREQSKAGSVNSQQRAEVGRLQIRCSKLNGRKALEACNQGLSIAPGNLAFYIGKADALMEMERFGEALGTYEDARVLDPTHTGIEKGMSKARKFRQTSAKKCFELNGSTALAACSAALQKGGADEAAILERQGNLLAAAGQKQAAANAYRAALSAGAGSSSIAAKPGGASPAGPDNQQPLAAAPPAVNAAPPSPLSIQKQFKASAPAVAPMPSKADSEMRPVPEVIAKAKSEDKPAAVELPGTAAPDPALPAPALAENGTGGYSNAPLPSGFTH